MKFAILAALALFTAAAHAADSTRLACDNGSVLLHVFEHRTGAEDRATDVTVIYGGYIFSGSIAEGAQSVLAPIGEYARAGNEFSGVITIDYAKGKVKVAGGALSLEGERIPVAAKFSCKELN
jgi:hypothetical protein